ncbi:hypothetical protein ASPZODRAFT_165081 [Penicilliopsis zonata CBS 506.65]|uniref:Fungal-type protein kinase domain-containing protein n=1 Tax=Penicilliopsis zonata CBS 506.65 TaxID=1073090 RepID=A0A1L9SM29_9EURO|nr:hypothetical protein ASPZODRAFT_165081 [Penicilliopsis zonata CBS 506.65]OJJ48151.1 hypothetical protein ASPZODRAFT_165081 [Penicilliopsis zonata CBS 506.65]
MIVYDQVLLLLRLLCLKSSSLRRERTAGPIFDFIHRSADMEKTALFDRECKGPVVIDIKDDLSPTKKLPVSFVPEKQISAGGFRGNDLYLSSVFQSFRPSARLGEMKTGFTHTMAWIRRDGQKRSETSHIISSLALFLSAVEAVQSLPITDDTFTGEVQLTCFPNREHASNTEEMLHPLKKALRALCHAEVQLFVVTLSGPVAQSICGIMTIENFWEWAMITQFALAFAFIVLARLFREIPSTPPRSHRDIWANTLLRQGIQYGQIQSSTHAPADDSAHRESFSIHCLTDPASRQRFHVGVDHGDEGVIVLSSPSFQESKQTVPADVTRATAGFKVTYRTRMKYRMSPSYEKMIVDRLVKAWMGRAVRGVSLALVGFEEDGHDTNLYFRETDHVEGTVEQNKELNK